MAISPTRTTRGWRVRPRRRRLLRLLGCIGAAALPLACVAPTAPRVENPFLGTWATADNNRITFRRDTVIEDMPSGPGVAFDKATCRGVFHFGYADRSRAALEGLVPRQPELRQRLSELLAAPSYRVAVLGCDQGDQTYVMLAPGQLLAIYRDGDIGAIERLARR
jgi:hypothetical protein